MSAIYWTQEKKKKEEIQMWALDNHVHPLTWVRIFRLMILIYIFLAIVSLLGSNCIYLSTYETPSTQMYHKQCNLDTFQIKDIL